MIQVKIKNFSLYKKAYSPIKLKKIAEKILEGECLPKNDYELSVVFCDDEFIKKLNKTYRKKNKPTDVLSFSVPPDFPAEQIRFLGEIIISLETVFHKNPDNPEKARQEIYLLYCHGLLHLLGYTHDTYQQRKEMMEKQAKYLNIDIESAWIQYPKE